MMAKEVRIAFEQQVLLLALDDILPSKMLAPPLKATAKYKRIVASVAQLVHRVDAYGDDPPAHGRGRLQGEARVPCVPRDGHHRLSRGGRHARKRAGHGRT